METLTLNIDSKIYDSFLKPLEQFKKDEIQIVSKNESFENAKKYLHRQCFVAWRQLRMWLAKTIDLKLNFQVQNQL